MSINNIEKQYNEDLDKLKKKINDYKDKFNQFKEVSKNTIKCNNNYLDLSKEKFDGYIFQGNGFCNASENRQFINSKDSSLNNQDQCKKICDSKDNCSGFTMFKPGTHVSNLEAKYEDLHDHIMTINGQVGSGILPRAEERIRNLDERLKRLEEKDQ